MPAPDESPAPAAPVSSDLRFQEVDRSATQVPTRDNHLRYVATALREGIEELVDLIDPREGDRVLDYGCAHQPYRELLPPGVDYRGADLAGNPDATVEVREDGTVDVEDCSQDVVLSTQVLEHVADPDRYLAECFRVLRPGGRLLLTTHGMMVYHPDPVDYWRWTCAGLRRVVAEPGFRVDHFRGIVGPAAVGAQLVQDALLSRVPARARRAYLTIGQWVVRSLDRHQSQGRRDHDALVFGIVARRPDA